MKTWSKVGGEAGKLGLLFVVNVWTWHIVATAMSRDNPLDLHLFVSLTATLLAGAFGGALLAAEPATAAAAALLNPMMWLAVLMGNVRGYYPTPWLHLLAGGYSVLVPAAGAAGACWATRRLRERLSD